LPVQVRVALVWKVKVTSPARPLRSVRLPLVGCPCSPGVKAMAARGETATRAATMKATATRAERSK